jgi:hypothetical protein
MEIDLHLKSQELLESLANSIHDRDKEKDICFTIQEVHVTEKFLERLVIELMRI